MIALPFDLPLSIIRLDQTIDDEIKKRNMGRLRFLGGM